MKRLPLYAVLFSLSAFPLILIADDPPESHPMVNQSSSTKPQQDNNLNGVINEAGQSVPANQFQ
ncbi:hypothetical protein [uncultured Legionella sp.]|uniref:hypothetical protein n=1 Tax=uncultured Legionella sp. TaxID=210934 RepID=UPI0026077C4C|nr:hypothetical protein [uncultured Legionella sp.]